MADEPILSEHPLGHNYHHDKSSHNYPDYKDQPWYYEDSFQDDIGVDRQHSPPGQHRHHHGGNHWRSSHHHQQPLTAQPPALYRPQLTVAASPTPTRRSATDPNLSSVLRPPQLPRRRLPPTPRQPSNLDIDKLQQQQKGNHLSKSSTDPNMLEATVDEASKQAVLEFNFPRLNFSPSHKAASSGPFSMVMRPFQSSMMGYVHGNGVGAMPGNGPSAISNGIRGLHTRRALPTPGHSELQRLRGGGRQLPSLAQHLAGVPGNGVKSIGGDPWPGSGIRDEYGLAPREHNSGIRGMDMTEEYEEEDWC